MGGPEADGIVDRGGDAGADGPPGGHEHVRVPAQRGDGHVHALQARSGSHDIAVVKGQHDGVARLGVDQRMYFINEENRIAVSRQFFDDSFQPFFYLPFVGSTRNQCSCVKLIDSHVL